MTNPMLDAGATEEAVVGSGLVAIVRRASTDEARRDVRTLIDAGVPAVEVSLVTPGALQVVAEALEARPPAGSRIGVGTVVTEPEARRVASLGADFAVSPNLCPEVIRTVRDAGMMMIAGAGTVTEALAAKSAGAQLQKIFPASMWSPRTVADVLTALPELRLVPTGGIGITEAADWVRAGAVAVGMGAALLAGDPATAQRRLRDLLDELARARQGS